MSVPASAPDPVTRTSRPRPLGTPLRNRWDPAVPRPPCPARGRCAARAPPLRPQRAHAAAAHDADGRSVRRAHPHRRLIPDPALACEDFADPYRWMLDQMELRLPTRGPSALWFWAKRRRKDLIRSIRYWGGDVLLTCRIPRERVLPSHFSDWHQVPRRPLRPGRGSRRRREAGLGLARRPPPRGPGHLAHHLRPDQLQAQRLLAGHRPRAPRRRRHRGRLDRAVTRLGK